MNLSIFLAIAVAVFGAINDLIYRKNKIHSGSGVVWRFYYLAALSSAVYCFIVLLFSQGGLSFTCQTIAFGVLIGIVSFATYILFLFSFDGVNTSVTITIFRVNLIPTTVLAVIYLGETLSFNRVIGIALCMISILLFSSMRQGKTLHHKNLLLSIGACVSCSMLNMLNKLAALNNLNSFQVMLWRFIVVSIISGFVLLKKKPGRASIREFSFPAISGLVLMLSVLCTLEALKISDVSAVIPITQMSFVITAVISWAAYKEKLGFTKLLGIACGALAVILIA